MKKNNKNRQDEEPRIAQVDIGELLLNKRLHLGVSVGQIAEMVKLNISVINKLESNQFSEIGSAVYVKGYLGLYAKHLGLDAAYVLNLYHSQYPTETVAIRPSLDHSIGRQQSKRYSKTVSFLLAFVTFVGLMYAYAKFEPQFLPVTTSPTESEETNEQTAHTEPGNAVISAIRAADSAQNLADDVLNNMPLPTTGNSPIASEGLSLLSPISDTEPQTSLTLATDTGAESPPTEVNSPSTIDTEDTRATTENSEQITNNEEQALEPAVKEIHLVMTFKKDCWLKITDAKGKILASNVYSKKRKIDVKGQAPFIAVIGRPYTVNSMHVDNNKVSLSDYKVGNVKYEIK